MKLTDAHDLKRVSYELSISDLRAPNLYYELIVQLTGEATLDSVECRKNELIPGSILTFHFSMPITAEEQDCSVRAFEVRSVPEHVPHFHKVFCGCWGEHYIYENQRRAEELLELELEAERFFGDEQNAAL